MQGKVQSHLLFTYGTMMSDCYNNGRISHKANKIGEGFSCEPFVMVAKRTPRQIPYVGRIPDVDYDGLSGKETPIFGEIYEIDDINLWRTIDRFEGHPHFYCRELIQVRSTAGVLLSCWAYLMDDQFQQTESPLQFGEHVPSGNFLHYYDPKIHKNQGHAKNAYWGRSSGYRQTSLIDRMERYTKN